MNGQSAASRESPANAASTARSPAWRRNALFLGVAFAVSQPAGAQTEPAVQGLEEIIVTATRREESLQDVALTVSAVTAAEIDELKLFKFEDVAQITPGLSMVQTNGGASGGVISLRGISFATNASTDPAVDVYYNEVPLDASYAMNSMFDIQQVEVLRGPQGTLRGRPAPAGAITMATHRPDLSEFGGYVSASASDLDVTNLQAAVNVPILEDKLALRIAAAKDKDEGGGQRDVTNGNHPEYDANAGRISVQFDPVESLSFVLAYQYMDPSFDGFDLVQGPGMGYNGPSLEADERRGVSDGMNNTKQDINLTTLFATWDLGSNRLVYVGGYQDLSFETKKDLDLANAVPDYAGIQDIDSDYTATTHELRLESSGTGRWDYILGLWYSDTHTQTVVNQPAELAGAFGVGTAAPTGPALPQYLLPVYMKIPTDTENAAIFGNVVFHVLDDTDLSLGLRYLDNQSNRSQTLETGAAQIAIDVTLPGLCPNILNALNIAGGGWVHSVYEARNPTYCDLGIKPSSYYQPGSAKDTAWVYNASLTHHFTDDVMSYFTIAHSWRPPGVTVGVTAPVPNEFLFGDPEESDAYELGMKSQWLDGRVRLNAALYYQTFDNFVGRFENVPFYNVDNGQVSAAGFSWGADASVTGVDVELGFLVTDNWTADLAFNYSDSSYDDSDVPCRDTNFDGKADGGPNPSGADWAANSPDDAVRLCESDDPISQLPDWSATLQSGYTLPRGKLEYYVNGFLTYQPSNDNVQTYWSRDSFALVNVFLGVRTAEPGWDASLWAKNLFDDDTTLDITQEQVYAGYASGYSSVRVQNERQIGMTLRYAFGGG